MDRKLIRPSLRAAPNRAGQAPQRRVTPETTHAEGGYLQQAVESKAPFVVELLGGEVVRGRLESHDRDVLIVAPEGRPAVVLRKERVRAYWLERPPAARAET